MMGSSLTNSSDSSSSSPFITKAADSPDVRSESSPSETPTIRARSNARPRIVSTRLFDSDSEEDQLDSQKDVNIKINNFKYY